MFSISRVHSPWGSSSHECVVIKVQLLNPSEEKSLGLQAKHPVLLTFTTGGGDAQANRTFYCAVYYVPGEQQGGACAQWADEMNGQFPSLVVGESEANLNVFQTADELWSSPAGFHAPAEHQLVPDVSAGLTSGGAAG